MFGQPLQPTSNPKKSGIEFVAVTPHRIKSGINISRIVNMEHLSHDSDGGDWYRSDTFSFQVHSDVLWTIDLHVVSLNVVLIVLNPASRGFICDEIRGKIFVIHSQREDLVIPFGPKVFCGEDIEDTLPIDVQIPLIIIGAKCELHIEIATNGGFEHDTLSEDLRKFYIADDFSDVVLEVDGEKLPAHRVILSARSNVFRAMFKSSIQESPVKITDIHVEVMKEILRYAYTGKVLEMEYLAVELMVAADKYNMVDLQKGCRAWLIGNLNSDKAVNLLIVADCLNDVPLKKLVTDFIICNLTKVIASSEWSSLLNHPVLVDELFKAISQTDIESKYKPKPRRFFK